MVQQITRLNKKSLEKYNTYDDRHEFEGDHGELKEDRIVFKKENNFFYILSIIPVVIVTYTQLAYNLFITISITNVLFKISNILSYDLEKYIDKKSHESFVKVLECSTEWVNNNCGQHNIPPVMVEYCNNWKFCMEQDTSYVLKSKETAGIMAEILNNFFENLSNKTLYCIGIVLVGSIIILNISLSWSRAKYKFKSL